MTIESISVPFPAEKLLPPEAIADGEVPVVLATCGSFNPIHTGHIAMFDEARRSLEAGITRVGAVGNRQVKVVGGFLSPVNDAYKKADLAPFDARYSLCQVALQSHPWLSVEPWEGMQASYQRSYVVLSRIREEVKRHYAGLGEAGARVAAKVQLVFVCGADLFESFFRPGCWTLSLLQRIFEEMLIVVFAREGVQDPHATMISAPPLTHADSPGTVLDMSRYADRVGVVALLDGRCASSTLVRRRIAAGESIVGLVPAECLEMLLESGMYPVAGKSRLRSSHRPSRVA